VPTDHPAQPQPRGYRQRERHPDLLANLLHPQLVCLHVLDIDLSLLHQMLMNLLTVLPGLREPARHRPLIEPERRGPELAEGSPGSGSRGTAT
jgi:hypothetical protein